MKRFALLFFAALLATAAVAQKSVEGAWRGTLRFSGMSVRLVLHLTKQGGTYAATLDSPDQGALGMPVSSVQLAGDSLVAEAAAIGGKLVGRFTSDTTFSGRWMQATLNVPLDMTRLAAGETVAEIGRPQTPKPPFPYKTEDVVYFNKDKSVQYGATVTTPPGAGPFPAVVLITGSGQQDRDETLFNHKPFAVLADYLTRRGLVVLRVDDRGVGKTTGDAVNATSKDFAGDVGVGLDYLKSLPQVAQQKLGLIGHSEGGMIAQLVAAERHDLDFVVMLAAPGQTIVDLMVDQNRAILEKEGMPATAANRYAELYRLLTPALSFAPTDTAARAAGLALLNDWANKTPKADVDILFEQPLTEAFKDSFLTQFLTPLRQPWFRYFLRYDPAPYVQKMKTKVLALNGEKDIQVLAKPNLAALRAALQKSGSKNFATVELKGLNHLFQRCQKCTIGEYAEIEETIAPEALEAIGTWLEKNVR